MTPDSQASVADPRRLVVEDLRVVVKRTGYDIVDKVSFAIGPRGGLRPRRRDSGSGKTTVALALAGHARRGLSITGGRVLLDDRDVLKLSAGELHHVRRRRIAYVPQDPSSALDPARRVGVQMAEALRVHGSEHEGAAARLREVLAEVRLDSSPETAALLPPPTFGWSAAAHHAGDGLCLPFALIVLDEPTTRLDVTTQRHVLEDHAHAVPLLRSSRCLRQSRPGGRRRACELCRRHVRGEARSVRRRAGGLFLARASLLAASSSHHSVGRARRGPARHRGQSPEAGARPPGCSFAPRCSLVLPACGADPPPAVELADGPTRALPARQRG